MTTMEVVKALDIKVGDLLIGTEYWANGVTHTCTIKIFGIGEQSVLARCLSCNSTSEGAWTLANRDWKKV